MNQPLHACGSWTSIYKCHCHDASTTVAPDHPQMETACHGEQCNRGKIQVNAVSLLIWGGSTLPLLPHSKHMNLPFFCFCFWSGFFVCLFLFHHYKASTKSSQNHKIRICISQAIRLPAPFVFRNLWYAPSLSCSAFESTEKLTTLYFLLKDRDLANR